MTRSAMLRALPQLSPAPDDAALSAAGERARGGDVEAFAAVYRAHHPRVHALALRLARDGAWAEELTQEVFVAAWRALPSFRGESALSTWLHRLAVRVILRALRADARRAARLETAEAVERFAAEARRAMPETRLDLERAIAALPAGARTVLVLHDVFGWQLGEIAAAIGRSLGTVKSQLHRARKLVAEALGS